MPPAGRRQYLQTPDLLPWGPWEPGADTIQLIIISRISSRSCYILLPLARHLLRRHQMAPRWHPDGTQMAPDGTQMAPLDIRGISELGGGGVFFGVGTLILAYR